MNERPFAAWPDGHGQRLHAAAASTAAIPCGDVQVLAPEAVRAVIAVRGAECFGADSLSALQAAKS